MFNYLKPNSSRLARISFASWALVLLLIPFQGFIGTWFGSLLGSELPKLWKEVLILVSLLSGLVAASRLSSWQSLVGEMMQKRFNQIGLAYLILHLVYVASFEVAGQAEVAGLILNLRLVAMLVISQLVFRLIDTSKLNNLVLDLLVPPAVIVSLFAVAQVWLLDKNFLTNFGYDKGLTIQPFFTVDQNLSALRAFSFTRGPNPLGAYLVTPIAVLFGLRRQVSTRLLIAVEALALLAVFLSRSRSAWVALMLSSAVLLYFLKRGRKVNYRYWLVAGCVGLGLLGSSLAYEPSRSKLLLYITHDDPSLNEGDADADRLMFISNGLNEALSSPLGDGVGSSGPASTRTSEPRISENYYIQIAHEVGVLGLMLFVALVIAVGKVLYANRSSLASQALLASLLGLSVANLFLHVWADDTTAIIWWGIAGLYVNQAKTA